MDTLSTDEQNESGTDMIEDPPTIRQVSMNQQSSRVGSRYTSIAWYASSFVKVFRAESHHITSAKNVKDEKSNAAVLIPVGDVEAFLYNVSMHEVRRRGSGKISRSEGITCISEIMFLMIQNSSRHDDVMASTVAGLERQVKELWAQVPSQTLQHSKTGQIAPNVRYLPEVLQLSPVSTLADGDSSISPHAGPTSTEFCLRIAETSLVADGNPTAVVDLTSAASELRYGVPVTSVRGDRPYPSSISDEYSNEDLEKYFQLYYDEIGLQNPVVDMEALRSYACSKFSRQIRQNDRYTARARDGEEVLTYVIAIAKVLENAQPLSVEAVEEDVYRRIRRRNPSIHDLIMLTLMAIYNFLRDDETLASRTIALALKICEEIGLSSQKSLVERFPDPHQRLQPIKLFWTAYVLDRRWSFGTGTSFALQDEDIDAELQEPGETSPYLQSMISYCRIGSDVRKFLMKPDTSLREISDTRAYLDFRVLKWQENLPNELRYSGTAELQRPYAHDRAQYRLRLLLYLRANQMRIVIHRNVFTAVSKSAQTCLTMGLVVEIAKNTIQVLLKLRECQNIYQSQPVTFDHFLHSALAVLMLAITRDVARFGPICQDEINSANQVLDRASVKSLRLKKFLEAMTRIQRRSAAAAASDLSSRHHRPSLGVVMEQRAGDIGSQENQDLSTRGAETPETGSANNPIQDALDSPWAQQQQRARNAMAAAIDQGPPPPRPPSIQNMVTPGSRSEFDGIRASGGGGVWNSNDNNNSHTLSITDELSRSDGWTHLVPPPNDGITASEPVMMADDPAQFQLDLFDLSQVDFDETLASFLGMGETMFF